MSNSYEDKCLNLQSLTQKWISELVQIWTRLFNHGMVNENLEKLTEHAKTFYNGLIEESLIKEEFVKKAISDLHEEAENLCRLLKTNVDLPKIEDENIPLVMMQSILDQSLTELREVLRQRRAQICELLVDQDALCDELGETPRALLDDPLPSQNEIDDFRNHLEDMKLERVRRMKEVANRRRDIKVNMQKLGLRVTTDSDDRLLNAREIRLNSETLSRLAQLDAHYQREVEEMQETINSIRKKVESLWDRLNTSPSSRRKLHRFVECNVDTYDAYYAELQRCEELKSQNIKMFVDKVRQEIVEWWDKTLMSEAQRKRFTHFYNKCYTDDLLVVHEIELNDLKNFYETNKQIFQLFEDRKVLWDRMNALEAKATDPGRYNNRGGQLLKEEKERKTIATKLPKIEQQIQELVRDFEEREHKSFLVYGEDILDLIAKEWEQKRQEKEKVTNARKQGQTSSSKLITTRTPLSVKNSTVSSIRNTPSTVNMSSMRGFSSQKRKLTGQERERPAAKRSLMHALNSPSVFRQPQAGALKKTPMKPSSAQKATKVIGSILRREQGRRSGNSAKKRRSLNKSGRKENRKTPKIVVNSTSDGQDDGATTDDTYIGFEKHIEPASRSTIVHQSTSSESTKITRSKRHLVIPSEDYRLQHLPNPNRMVRTPSKLNLRGGQAVSPGNFSRKLTTKDLPIII